MDRRRFMLDTGSALLGTLAAGPAAAQVQPKPAAAGEPRSKPAAKGPRLVVPQAAGGTFRQLGSQTLAGFLNTVRAALPEGRDAANTRLKPAHNILAYCGATIWRDKYSLGIAGGHGDSHDDGHYAQDLATGLWDVYLGPSSVASASAVADAYGEWIAGRPASQHSYNHLVTVDDDILQGYGYAIANAASGSVQAHLWSGVGKAWQRYGTGGTLRPVPHTVLHDPTRRRIVRFPHEAWRSVDVIATGNPSASWTTVPTPAWPAISIQASIGYHAGVDCYVLIDEVAKPGQAWVMDPDNIVLGWQSVSVSGTPPSGAANTGLEYAPPMHALVAAHLREPGTLYYLVPVNGRLGPWAWTKETFSGPTSAAPWEVNPGVPIAPYGRVKWSSLLRGLVMVKSALAPTEVFTPSTTAGSPGTPEVPPDSPPIGSVSGIVLDDSGSGVSRDFYHYGLRISWRGSFAGAVLGSTTVAGAGTFAIPISSVPEYVVLRRKSVWANVHSRESGRGSRIEVTYDDGSTGVLPCIADATIDPSTAAPQGVEQRLVLGTAVLRFARPSRAVIKASLVGEAIATGGTTTLEATEFVSPLLPEPAAQYGLRRRGLGGPTLIHATDFGVPNWMHPWFTLLSLKPSADKFNIVDTDQETGASLGRKAYCITLNPDGSFVPPVGPPESPAFVFPANIGRELEEVYFQYRLRFGQGWRGGSTQSGKLPGIASDTTVAGNGGGTANGKNGWSFRGLFVGEPFSPASPYNSNNGVVPIGWYTYNPDQVAQNQIFGLHVPWTGRGSLGLLEVGKDYWIDQYVKVNTPGQRDGIVRAWINGQLAYERTDHVMRDLPPYQVAGNLGINKIWMTFLHGGDILPLPTKTLRTYWSDWTIASEYIGPPAPSGNAPPAVVITSPQSGAAFAAGATIPVSVSASDGDGSVARVDLYLDGTLVGTDTAVPFAMTVAGTPTGSHTLVAVATDNLNAVASSAPVGISVGATANVPPTVAITSPANGSSFVAGTTISVSATASDAGGSIASVVLRADGAVFASFAGATPPYVAPLAGLAAGVHVLTATATDNAGASTTSTAVSVTVTSAAVPRTVTLQDGSLGYAGTRDTYLSSWYKNENYGRLATLLESAAYVDLVRFAVFASEGGPVPDGATITAATLSIYKTTNYDFTYEARRMLVSWVEGETTWNRPRAGATWATAGAGRAGVDYAATADATARVGFAPGWLTFDVTAGLRVLAGGQPNCGWRLNRVGGNGNEKRFAGREYPTASLRPKLVVSFVAA